MTASSTNVGANLDVEPQPDDRARQEGFALGLPPRAALLPRNGWLALVALDHRDGHLRAGRRARAAGDEHVPSLRVFDDADRQAHVLRDRRARARSRVGLLRHPEPRARALLRARRLRDGHVPDALDRPRRHVPERPARLHGVPRLAQAAVVLGGHRASLVCAGARRAGARRFSRGCSASSRSARA